MRFRVARARSLPQPGRGIGRRAASERAFKLTAPARSGQRWPTAFLQPHSTGFRWHDAAKPAERAADAVDWRGALLDEAFAQAVQRLQRLLLERLDRQEAHARVLHALRISAASAASAVRACPQGGTG
jgi:hypothetical protein